MTVSDLLKQLGNEDKDKVVIFKDSLKGWCNLKASIVKTETYVVVYEDTDGFDD